MRMAKCSAFVWSDPAAVMGGIIDSGSAPSENGGTEEQRESDEAKLGLELDVESVWMTGGTREIWRRDCN